MSRQTFYFGDGPYLQAMQGLHSALSGAEAFVKFVGQARTGKSGVCEKLTHYMRHKDHRVIYFDYTIESPDMLHSMLAKALGVPDSSKMLRHLEGALGKEFEKPLIIIFDDAHQLSDITLIEISRLASVQVNRRRVINIVLCGEPELERRLSGKKQFAPLLQHVTHNFLLEPMDVEATARFVQAYLVQVGRTEMRIEAAASNQLFKSSRGFPGPAYSLSQLVSSLRQPGEEQRAISKEELQRAIRNADAGQPVPSGLHRMGDRRKVFAPLAAVLLIASLALLLRMLSPAEELPQAAIDETPDSSAVTVPNTPAASPFAIDEPNASVLDAPRGERGVAQLPSVMLTRPMLALDDEGAAEPAAVAPVDAAVDPDEAPSANPVSAEP